MHLSVVVPFCEQADALEQTLNSLLAMEPTAAGDQVEIVVCNNGGAATTSSTLAAYGDRIVVAQPPARLSTLELWDFAVRASAGDWFAVLTPQTTVRPHFARALCEAAARSPESSVVRAGWTRARARGGSPEQHTLLSVRTVTHPAEALYEQRMGPKASTAAAAIRRSAWEAMGGFPPEIGLVGDWIGDWALWLAAGALGDTVRSPEVVADIRLTPVTPLESYAKTKAVEMRELHAIYRLVMPRACSAAHVEDCSWIEAASRKRFRDVAIAASNEMRPGPSADRMQIATAMMPWAQAVEQVPLLRRFEAGEKIRSFTLGKKMKPAIRRVVAAVR